MNTNAATVIKGETYIISIIFRANVQSNIDGMEWNESRMKSNDRNTWNVLHSENKDG